MLGVMFHIVFSLFVFSGVVLFPIFAWLKIHETNCAVDTETLLHSNSI